MSIQSTGSSPYCAPQDLRQIQNAYSQEDSANTPDLSQLHKFQDGIDDEHSTGCPAVLGDPSAAQEGIDRVHRNSTSVTTPSNSSVPNIFGYPFDPETAAQIKQLEREVAALEISSSSLSAGGSRNSCCTIM